MRGNGNLIQTFSQSLSDLPPLLPVSLPDTPSLAITTSSTSTTTRCQKPLRDVEQRAAMNLPLDAIFPPTTINNVNIKAHDNRSFRYSSSNIAHFSLIFFKWFTHNYKSAQYIWLRNITFSVTCCTQRCTKTCYCLSRRWQYCYFEPGQKTRWAVSLSGSVIKRVALLFHSS